LHGPETAGGWTLKQVQGDEKGFESVQIRHAELVSASMGPQAMSPQRQPKTAA
jgi:hypothetical protein